MCEMNAVESATGGAIWNACGAERPLAWAAVPVPRATSAAEVATTPASRSLPRRVGAVARLLEGSRMIVSRTSLDGLPHARGTGRPRREAILTRPLQVNERPGRLPACITLREDLRHGPRRTRPRQTLPHAGRIWLWTACSAGRLRTLHWPERRLARSLLGWSGGGAGRRAAERGVVLHEEVF